MMVLRDDLLDGCSIAVLDGASGLRTRLASLGAQVVEMEAATFADDADGTASDAGALDALVCDVGFSTVAGADPLEVVDRAWPAIRSVAVGALIPRAEGEGAADLATRKILLIGPRPDDRAQTEAARASLENLARTLSIEWARHSIVATMIAPGRETSQDELETLVAFLCSAGGHYYSGSRFDLGTVTVRR